MMRFLFSEEKYFAYILSLFFPLVFFVYCVSTVFFRFAAEAGIKGGMSFLDAPDA